MNTAEQTFETTPIDKLHLHPRNPRQGDVRQIRNSIQVNGWYGAVVAQRSTGHILAGNHRFKAALMSGAKTIPVIWVDVDDEAALRILLADNRTSDLAANDEGSLAATLDELVRTSQGLEGTGFDTKDLDRLLDRLNQQFESEEAGDQTGELSDQFQVLVTCRSEQEQTNLLSRLAEDGFDCRALLA